MCTVHETEQFCLAVLVQPYAFLKAYEVIAAGYIMYAYWIFMTFPKDFVTRNDL